MRVLGLNLSPHDTSAAIVENGETVIAIEEERLNRIRHSMDYDSEMYTLEDEAKYFDSTFLTPSDTDIRGRLNKFSKYFEEAGFEMDSVDYVVGSSLMKTNVPIEGYININHHMAHAYHAFFTSPYKEAAVLVVDGAGDFNDGKFETVSLYSAKNGQINLIEKINGSIEHETNTIIALSNSIGVMYQNAAALCGFGPLGEGKLMGLSSYGEPIYLAEFQKYTRRDNDMLIIDNLGLYKCMSKILSENKSHRNLENIARSIQDLTNICVLHYAKKLHTLTGYKNLCYSGGVALNVIANSILLEESGFDNIYIPSAPGDNGISIGAALYGHFHIGKGKTRALKDIPSVYLGREYTDKEIYSSLDSYEDSIRVDELSEDELIQRVVKILNDGMSVAWFDGRSEFGPRALGNRSILMSPNSNLARETLNKIKGREKFRPVAPMILAEAVDKYFSIPKQSKPDSLPYMLFVAKPLSKEVATSIPSAIHVDNTARIQTVTESQNRRIYKLIQEFCKMSGVPILINTSFNIKGEPVVETPDDALKTFTNSDFDYLVLANNLIKRL